MIVVECPSCLARFRVPPSAIPEDGRDFRCSACGHAWHYVDPLRTLAPAPEPESEGPEEKAIPSFPDVIAEVIRAQEEPESKKQPVVSSTTLPPVRNVRAMAAGYAAAALVGFFILFLLGAGQGVVVALVPRLAVVYQLAGVYVPPTFPLTFQNVTLERIEGKVTIKGLVVNQTDTQRNIPEIRVVLTAGDSGEIPEPWIFRAEKTFVDSMKKNGTVPFEIARTLERADSITKIRLEFVEKKPGF